MRLSWFGWVALVLAGCPTPVSQDVRGSLVAVEVAAVDDSCTPHRFVGDGGVQFFGFQPSGSGVISSSYAAFWGPPRVDGGVIAPGSRQDFVFDREVNLTQGYDSNRICGRLFYTWSTPDGGAPWAVQLNQRWEAIDLGCANPGVELPLTACSSTRLFTLSPISECDLGCIRVHADGDVTCECTK